METGGGLAFWIFANTGSHDDENEKKKCKKFKKVKIKKNDLDIWWTGSFPQKM